MAFVETPRTNYGDTTELGYDGIENVSPEKSWHPPQKRENDLVAKLRGQRGLDVRTPNSRNPLTLRPNQQKAPATDEISLLLKSTTKPLVRDRRGERYGVPKTPAVLKNGYKDIATPALDVGDSLLASSEAGSYADGRTPLPAMPPSSGQSTPIPDLGAKNANGLVSDARNQMTLREQESIIDKLEKENFGLKLKIHYLEDILRKADPNYSKTAVKENTDLKVEKIQLETEKKKLTKQLRIAEQTSERLHQELQLQEREGRRNGEDGTEAREEADRLRHQLEEAQGELDGLREELRRAEDSQSQVEKLEADVQDLEAEIRQKDVEINDRDEKLEKMDEKIEELQAESEKREDERAENEDQSEEIEELKDKISDLEADYRALERDLDQVKEAKDEADQQKDDALAELKELQEEASERSANSKGFADEIQQKARKLEQDLREALAKHENFEKEIQQHQEEARQVEVRLNLSREEATSREKALKEKVADYERKIQTFAKLHQSTDGQFQNIRQDLQERIDERDALQVKYDTLDQESREWKDDLVACKKEIAELQEEIEFEKRQAAESEAALREETNADREDLQADVYELKRRLENIQDEMEAEQERWESEKRQLSLQRDQAESRVEGLENTIAQIRSARDDVSGKESKLKGILASEEQRHRREENLLQGQIEQMEQELRQKQQSLDQLRSEHVLIKDEARLSKQEATDAERKLQALEDEVQVLSNMLEEEQKRAQEKIAVARQEADAVRKDLLDVRQAKQRVENRLKDAQEASQRIPQTPAATRDAKQRLEQKVREQENQLDKLRYHKDTLETKLKRAEGDHDAAKRRTTELENDLRQTLAAKSAGSPTSSSVLNNNARKELEDVRRQVREARREADEAREKRKTVEKELRSKLSEVEATSRQRLLAQDQLRDEFETRIADLESQLQESEALRQSAEKTVSRLRARIEKLEKDLKDANSHQNKDDTMLSERFNLQTSLEESRQEAEALRVDLATAANKLKLFKEREAEHKSALKRLRTERSTAAAQAGTLDEELKAVQARHERKHDELRRQREELRSQIEDLRRDKTDSDGLARRLKKSEASLAQMQKHAARDEARRQEERREGLQEEEARRQQEESRHQQELAGLARQIQWLRAKGKREEAFRAGLAFEKRFLLMNVDMYQSFNQVDLGLLQKMGITPDTHADDAKKGAKKSLKAAAYAVIAIARMKQGMRSWRESKRIKDSLVREVRHMEGRQTTAAARDRRR